MLRFALLLSTLILALSLTACEERTVSLGFNTQNPTPDDYRLTSSLHVLLSTDSVKSSSPESMSAKVDVLVHSELLSAYDDGTGRFLLRVDSAIYSSDSRSVEETDHVERFLKTQVVQYKMGGDGEMSSVRFDDMASFPDVGDVDVRNLFLKVQPILPGTPVSVGDSWERQQAIAGDDGGQNVVYKWFKLSDVFEKDGIELAKLEMNIRYRQHGEDDKQITESPDFVLGSGVILFDIRAGKIVEGDLQIEGRVRVIEKKSSDTIPDFRVRQRISIRKVGG